MHWTIRVVSREVHWTIRVVGREVHWTIRVVGREVHWTIGVLSREQRKERIRMIGGQTKRLGHQCVCLKCHVAKSSSYLAVTSLSTYH